jgi:hypothetical protein
MKKSTTIGVDIAKSVFEIAISDRPGLLGGAAGESTLI